MTLAPAFKPGTKETQRNTRFPLVVLESQRDGTSLAPAFKPGEREAQRNTRFPFLVLEFRRDDRNLREVVADNAAPGMSFVSIRLTGRMRMRVHRLR